MEILDASNLINRGHSAGERAHITQLHPSGASGYGLLAVDLLEIEPGGSTAMAEDAEEHLLFVVLGEGEMRGAGGSVGLLRADSVVFIGPYEAHSLRNTGRERLRVLVSTPLLVRSARSLGFTPPTEKPVTPAAAPASEQEPAPHERTRPSAIAETPAQEKPVAQPPPSRVEDEAPLPDISALMKRGSDIAASPRPERKRPPVPREPEPEPEQVEPEAGTDDEEEDSHPEMMELSVVFDGGSRGNPGQG